MNRRDALKSLLALSGSVTVLGADRFLAGEMNPDPTAAIRRFTPDVLELLGDITETIIPTTPDSGGARAAGIPDFIREIVADYGSLEEQATLFAGIDTITTAAQETSGGKGFSELTMAEREALLMTFETQPRDPGYQAIKQLTVWGYFSSEVGQTEALAYDPVPGVYEGDIPLQPGQKAWN